MNYGVYMEISFAAIDLYLQKIDMKASEVCKIRKNSSGFT
jgi:hypothetical protein